MGRREAAGDERKGQQARNRVLSVLLIAGLIVAAVILAGTIARRQAADALASGAEAGLPLAMAALRSEIEKQRIVPLILSEDAAIRALLAAPDADRRAAANLKLERLARATRASVIYLLDRSGMTIAASNHREATSFVGSDYRFRRYFTDAALDGTAEQYALGTVSRAPGVYFSHRVDGEGVDGEGGGEGGGDGRPAMLGVVVVKVELGAVEVDWERAGRPVYVTDERGIVLATSVPAWRFRTLSPISPPDAAAIRDSLQFGDVRLDAMPLRDAGTLGDARLVSAAEAGADVSGDGARGEGGDRLFVAAEAPVTSGLAGWRMTLLVPAGRALLAAGLVAAVVAGLSLSLLSFLAVWLLRARRRASLRLEEKIRAAAELEDRVGQRTAELSAANTRLLAEMAEREKAEARVLGLREDLIQANRLAALGQITAGVAHEINQPLAAIRIYAENAGRFLSRGDTASTDANLGLVVGLTERIGAITETLRGFARRATGKVEPLPLAGPIEGALLIVGSRLRDADVVLDRGPFDESLAVHGNRIRLEQVLVNLLRNAMEALDETPGPVIRLAVEAEGDAVLVHVTDNGPGIAPEILPKLFTPFSTSKPKGLGLGLVISGDILSEFGGALTAESRPGEGARFTMRLRRAGV